MPHPWMTEDGLVIDDYAEDEDMELKEEYTHGGLCSILATATREEREAAAAIADAKLQDDRATLVLDAYKKELEAEDKELKRQREVIEGLREELEGLRAYKRTRKSVEAALPETRVWSNAEAYVLTPNPEALVGVVGEQYDKLGDDTVFGVNANAKDPSLLVHDPERGYVSAGPVLSDALDSLLTEVRKSVRAVTIAKDDQKSLDTTMKNNLKNPGTLASKITKAKIKTALVSHLRSVPSNVLSLDAQKGLFNLCGGKVASYDHVTGRH